jgi:hypothetical protein
MSSDQIQKRMKRRFLHIFLVNKSQKTEDKVESRSTIENERLKMKQEDIVLLIDIC